MNRIVGPRRVEANILNNIAAVYNLIEGKQKALDDDSLLLEYAIGEERFYLWAVTNTSITAHELPGRKEIEQAASNLRDLLTARNRSLRFEEPNEKQARITQADAEYPKAAAALSQMLLGPVANQLGKKRLLIVADGELQYAPFAALPLPESGRAGERESGGAGDGETGRRGDGETGRRGEKEPLPPSPGRPIAPSPSFP